MELIGGFDGAGEVGIDFIPNRDIIWPQAWKLAYIK